MTLRGQQYTLAQLVALLRTWVDDSSDARWTAENKANAIQGAIMAARGHLGDAGVQLHKRYGCRQVVCD